MVSRWRLWKIGLFVGSGLMYYLAQWSNMMVIETVQQNGLHAIVYPYSDLAYYSSSIASWLLIFGIFLLPIRIRQGEKPQRLLMGCALLSCGIVATGYGVFLQGDFTMIATILVIGIVAAGSGVWLLASTRVPKSSYSIS